MNERYKHFNYKITDDPEYMNDIFGITPELAGKMSSIYFQAQKGGKKVTEKLIHLVEKYPHVPQLKNFLSVAYLNSGNIEKSREINHWILKEHPDYLFGKINLGLEYYALKEYEKIPEVIGNATDLQDLYPERNCFHISEVMGYNKLAILYFCAIGNLPAAESRYEIIEKLAPDHPVAKEVLPYLMIARLEASLKRMEEEARTKISVKTNPYNKKLKNETKPEFTHKEVHWLYENDFRIDTEKLKAILDLPHESLVSDLKVVLKDAIHRYEFFINMADNGECSDNLLSFPIHAIYILGELKAEEALNDVLETFMQGEEFIEFWYHDFMTDHFWQTLFHIAGKQLEALKHFIMLPGIWRHARTEISTCVQQIAFHQPERKEEVIQWFREVFRLIAQASLKDNIIDSDFLGYAIWNAIEIRDPELIPEMKKLFDLGYVSTGICGDFEEIEQDIHEPARDCDKKNLLNIYENYEQAISTSSDYKVDEDDFIFEKKVPFRAEVKTGRNDPCPCGSGKKFKKCCFEKHQN